MHRNPVLALLEYQKETQGEREGGEMVRGGAKKEENAEVDERKRLKRLALKNNLLSERHAAASGSHALSPSKIVMKHHGKDIIKKSQRSGKNRFLFSFPGLLAPISGGKIGELKDLGTKNPILYLDFPQGQMKLFGTIVYPKNRYLTLQFSRSGKNVMCEDYFDNMVVFSDAWWIGRKDENPDEARLEFPAELKVEQMEYDFKGGAGATCDKKPLVSKPGAKLGEERTPKREFKEDSSGSQNNSKKFVEVTPTRHSARMAGKTFKFAEASSGDDFVEIGGETSEEEEEKVDTEDLPKSDSYKKTDSPHHVVLNTDQADAQIGIPVPGKRKQPVKSASKTNEQSQSNKGPLVQATISTLFNKVEKGGHTDVKENKDDVKVSGSKRKGKAIEEKKTGTESTVQKRKASVQLTAEKKRSKVEADDDDIEEFTSTSKESIESSDDDWVA